ncbi:MAG: hypothetical protein EP330_05355 [Deltaproteobacteria bacterium]|nr:MAG: hypothetical protein EP330_05355 [Deltaproteobacteria bacterium]
MKRLILVGLALASSVACMPSKMMLSEGFVPGHDKTARASIKTVGSAGSGDNKTLLSNYYIQICDVDNGVASNCRTNLILENVTDYQVQTGWSLK